MCVIVHRSAVVDLISVMAFVRSCFAFVLGVEKDVVGRVVVFQIFST